MLIAELWLNEVLYIIVHVYYFAKIRNIHMNTRAHMPPLSCMHSIYIY
jgi:hypothetical protein